MVVDQSLSCFIKDENTGKFVHFNIEKPEGYSDSYTANFMQQDVRGRHNPFQSYINSGPRAISFSVLIALDYRRDLAEQTDAIRKMMMPYKSEAGSLIKAPKVTVRIGKALLITAIPESFQAEWTGGYKEGIYRLCTWSFSFKEVSESPLFNNKTDVGASRSEIPLGLDNFLNSEGGVSSEEPGPSVGGTYTVSSGSFIGYKTYNDALNNNNTAEGIETQQVLYEDKEYYVSNIKNNAVLLTEGEGGKVIGWVVR